jgi:hypothetical protein
MPAPSNSQAYERVLSSVASDAGQNLLPALAEQADPTREAMGGSEQNDRIISRYVHYGAIEVIGLISYIY